MRYKRYTLADLEKSASQKKFNVVSFFAGGGGSSGGYKLAGGDVICVNEFQQIHADAYSAHENAGANRYDENGKLINAK